MFWSCSSVISSKYTGRFFSFPFIWHNPFMYKFPYPKSFSQVKFHFFTARHCFSLSIKKCVGCLNLLGCIIVFLSFVLLIIRIISRWLIGIFTLSLISKTSMYFMYLLGVNWDPWSDFLRYFLFPLLRLPCPFRQKKMFAGTFFYLMNIHITPNILAHAHNCMCEYFL